MGTSFENSLLIFTRTVHELPDDTDPDKRTWDFLVECLAGGVLWDNDYESQASLDLPPEESKRFRATLGMTEDYYTAIPPDPPDVQVNLYVDALNRLSILRLRRCGLAAGQGDIKIKTDLPITGASYNIGIAF